MNGGRIPVNRVEVDTRHVKLRVVLLAAVSVIAIAAFGYGIHAAVNRSSGWQTVEADSAAVNCSGDFTVEYYFGAAGISASAEYKAVSALYTAAVEAGYRNFYPDGELAAINAQPNTPVETDPILYHALEQLQASGNRCLYLAPIYEEYDRMFLCENEGEAARYDPGQNAELQAYAAQIAAFANDPEMIDLELLDGCRVRLNVSQAYLAFAAEHGITEFLDFGWMKNAFITDHIADTLASAGHTLGFVASYDGFTRNLDSSGQSYRFNLFDRLGDVIYRPAVMEYSGPMSIVSLRNYPLSEADRWHYYAFSNGRIATVFTDPADGMNKSATDNLVACSAQLGCSEILLQTAPIFLADVLDEAALAALPQQQVDAIWFEGSVLKHTPSAPRLIAAEDAETAGYRIS